MSHRPVVFILILALLAVGCAGRAWNQARDEDSVAAYHRFLRDHSESEYADEARARMEFARVRNKPSRIAFERFQKKHPDSPLVAELRPYVEEHFFAEARALGTEAAYQEFLADFPGGAYSARAEGNANYLEADGFGGDVERLAAFAEAYPESDYSAEAQRSVAAVATRDRSSFRRVALVLDIHPTTPGAERVARVFTERAAAAYEGSGIQLVATSGPSDPHLAQHEMRLLISHREQQVGSELEAGHVSQPGFLARTVVTLLRKGSETPVWSDSFEHRVSPTEHRVDASILFSAGSAPYWSAFFVPVATWDTQVAARETRRFAKPPAAIEVVGSRAIVLFGDGDFQMFDIGDPASPVLLADYHRPRDLAKFDGVRAGVGELAIFGPEGIEIVRLGQKGPQRVAVHGRDEVGSVNEVIRIGSELVVASNHGLLAADPSGGFKKLVPRPILGLERMGDRLLFTDGASLYVATLPLLRAGRIEAELRIGRGFGPSRVRVTGTTALVIGSRGLLRVDLSNPAQPRAVSRIEVSEVGSIGDAAVLGGRVFLLGQRGLQVSDRGGERVVDSVDVTPRGRLATSGRHLVAIGPDGLQVVDATAFLTTGGAAKQARP